MNINTVDDADDDESFDVLANMPPTPPGLAPPSDGFGASGGGFNGGGGGGSGGGDDDDADESFTDILGIRDFPTTPAAAKQQGVRRSPRLAARFVDGGGTGIDVGVGTGTGTVGKINLGLALPPPGSSVKGSGGRLGVGGGGIGGAAGGTSSGSVTPYSSRRIERRAAGQGAFSEAFTPGTAHGDGDDANASFRLSLFLCVRCFVDFFILAFGWVFYVCALFSSSFIGCCFPVILFCFVLFSLVYSVGRGINTPAGLCFFYFFAVTRGLHRTDLVPRYRVYHVYKPAIPS